MKNRKLIFIGFILLSIISLVYDLSQKNLTKTTTSTTSEMYVTLEGAFNKTGKYTFKEGDTIEDVINDIGTTKDANIEALKLDKQLEDEESIYLPVQSSMCININIASNKELQQLERIGEKTAEKIITYRETTPFNKIEDLKNISGIGDKTFLKIRDHVCL